MRGLLVALALFGCGGAGEKDTENALSKVRCMGYMAVDIPECKSAGERIADCCAEKAPSAGAMASSCIEEFARGVGATCALHTMEDSRPACIALFPCR